MVIDSLQGQIKQEVVGEVKELKMQLDKINFKTSSSSNTNNSSLKLNFMRT
jgi:hypothetical protein